MPRKSKASKARSEAHKGPHKKTGRSATPASRDALNQFKVEAASEVGVSLKSGYNGDMSAKDAGKIGGHMVKKMVESYKKNK